MYWGMARGMAGDPQQERIALNRRSGHSGRVCTRSLSAESSSSKRSGWVAPPMKTRSSTVPAGARLGNFTLENEAARIDRPSIAGTTTPKPSSGCCTWSRR